ncbi:aspartic peptidase domain-containing protein [Achaetomium macrosporum]|uniref:Aspartic peptidase domain-containing protein n=1 Tax=Achaetomium macrosporum TaxID=79813 RepID=A0AAN7CBF8_9PEZI|nr:aspartic peptidase domain-containing protein [Achaetomium macrosporum]
MSPVKSLSFAAAIASSVVSFASAAVLDLPIIIHNGYEMVELDVGTPPHTYRLMFDTGSASTWIVDKECAESCPNVSGFDRNPGYDVTSSSTANLTGQDASIEYLGGRVAGVTAIDEFRSGDLSWSQPFIAANESNWAAQPNHGFLGLAFGSIADGGATPVFEQLMASGMLDRPRFGLYYDQDNSDGPEGGHSKGRLTLGGSREEEYVEGEMVTIQLTQSSGDYDVWRSVLHTVSGTFTTANGTKAEAQTDLFGASVVFDTGASHISLPPDNIEAVYASIGMNWTAIIEGDHIPLCTEFNDSWSVTFELGFYGDTRTISLTGDQLALPGFANREDACWPPFDDQGRAGFALLGKKLLRRFYTIWDYGSFPVKGQYHESTLSFGKLKSQK